SADWKLIGRLKQSALQERVNRIDCGAHAFDPSVVHSHPHRVPAEEYDGSPTVGLAAEVIVVELPLAPLVDNGRRVIGFPNFDGGTPGRIAATARIQQEPTKGCLIHDRVPLPSILWTRPLGKCDNSSAFASRADRDWRGARPTQRPDAHPPRAEREQDQ